MGLALGCVRAAFTVVWWFWFVATAGAAVYYFIQRAEHTLNVEWFGYGVFILVVEILAALSTLLSALAMTLSGQSGNGEQRKARESEGAGRALRVLVYATGEQLKNVKETVATLLHARIPDSCYKVIYVLDDGKDLELKKWALRSRDNEGGVVEYVSRKVDPLENNPRSRSFNYLLASIYRLKFKAAAPVVEVGPRDVVFVLDVGQLCSVDFFEQNLAELHKGHAMVLSPQGGRSSSKIANSLCRELRTTSLGAVPPSAQTVSLRANFAVRSETLKSVDFFDKTVPVEHYALMAELAKRGESFTYLGRPLARTRKAKGLRRVFFERSTWALSSVLVLFGRRNPFYNSKLPHSQKLAYMAASVAQLVSILVTPVFLVVPVLAVWLGMLPAVVEDSAKNSFIIFYGASALLQYTSLSPVQVGMASLADHVFWFAYLRGLIQGLHHSMKSRNTATTTINAVVESMKKGATDDILDTKSTTASSQQADRYLIPIGERAEDQAGPSSSGEITESSMSDMNLGEHSDVKSEGSIASPEKKKVYVPQAAGRSHQMHFEILIAALTLIVSAGTTVFAVKLIASDPEPNVKSILLFSAAWSIFNAIPPAVILYYALLKTNGMRYIAIVATVASLLTVLATFVAVWVQNVHVHDYGRVLSKSFMFFEAQKSGSLPRHNRVPWRGDSGLQDMTVDKKSLVGGLYDGDGTLKHGFPLAVATSLLAWGVVEFPDGYGKEINHAEDIIRQATDYLLRSHTKSDEFYVLVESRGEWGRPEERLEGKRRVGRFIDPNKPGSDVAASTAAALAAASIVFKKSDPTYAEDLLEHARLLYSFADEYHGIYSDNIKSTKYVSSSFKDDLSWGAAWLYYATRENAYIRDAERHLGDQELSPVMDWDNVGPAACVLLATITKDEKYTSCSEKVLDFWKEKVIVTPSRLAWSGEVDPLPRVANAALLALVYNKNMKGEGVSDRKLGGYECWAVLQAGYLLGDGGRSFVVGYGENPPKQPRHQGASCPNLPFECSAVNESIDEPNPQELVGALVSGPDRNDEYEDSRLEIVQSRVSLMNNAGFTSVLAALSSAKDFAKCYHGFGVVEWLKIVNI